jgi:CRP/FNR family transcriptional regulator
MNSAQKKIDEFFTPYPTKVFKKGDMVIQPDEELPSLFYIVDGNIRMFALSEDGEEKTLTIFRSGSYFPLMLVLSSEKNAYYFEAVTNTTCKVAPTEGVLAFIKNDNEVLFDITQRFAQGIVGLSKRITETSTKNITERIESLQSYIQTKFPNNEIHLRHEDIASWLGISRETVSRAITKMKR